MVVYSKIVIVCKYAKPIHYVISLKMFEVELTDEIIFLQPGCELYANSLDLYEINGKKFVRPSNYVCVSSRHSVEEAFCVCQSSTTSEFIN